MYKKYNRTKEKKEKNEQTIKRNGHRNQTLRLGNVQQTEDRSSKLAIYIIYFFIQLII